MFTSETQVTNILNVFQIQSHGPNLSSLSLMKTWTWEGTKQYIEILFYFSVIHHELILVISFFVRTKV